MTWLARGHVLFRGYEILAHHCAPCSDSYDFYQTLSWPYIDHADMVVSLSCRLQYIHIASTFIHMPSPSNHHPAIILQP